MLRKLAVLPPAVKYLIIALLVIALSLSAYGMAQVFAAISPPSVTNTAVNNAVISPNNDGVKDAATITYTIDEPADVKLQVYNTTGVLVHEGAIVTVAAAGTYSNLNWDGAGGLDGQSYRLVIWAQDKSPQQLVSTTEVGTTTEPDVTMDLTGPVINNVQSTNITVTSATITWNTDEAGTSKVEYRSSGSIDWSATTEDTTFATAHTVNLSGLTGDTVYEYRSFGKDAAGNGAYSAVSTFRTQAPDTTPPSFSVGFYTTPQFTPGTELPYKNGVPVTKVQPVYLQITANEALSGAPLVDIEDGQAGTNGNEVIDGASASVSSNTYRYQWNVGDYGDREFTVNITGTDSSGNTATKVLPTAGDIVALDATVSSPTISPGESYPGFVKLTWSDTQTDIKNFKIYRSLTAGFTPDDATNLLTTVSANTFLYNDKTATYPNTYFYKIKTVDIAGNHSVPSAETSGSPSKVNPHGNYDDNTRMCGECHNGHASNSKDLIADNDAKTTCYLCHSPGGQSQYDVKSSLLKAGSRHPVELASTDPNHTQLAGSVSCEQCHNPHGDIKTPPSTYYTKLLRTRDTAGIYREGNNFCFACHGDAVNSPAYLGNKEANYPAAGSPHNNPDWTAPNGQKPFNLLGNGIACYACHDTHGSDLPKLIKKGSDYSNDNTPTAANDRNLCYDCHTADPGVIANTWGGKAVYEARGHGSPTGPGATDCKSCHDSHGTPNGKNLKKKYDLTSSPTRNKLFASGDYELCFTCHLEADLFDAAYATKKTAFSDRATGRNLHKLHVKDRTDVTCRECHRPHGADPSEQTGGTTVHNVGWPDRNTVGASTQAASGPLYTHDPGGVSGGSCALTCHNKDHSGSAAYTYDNSHVYGDSGGGDTNCYNCHSPGRSGPDIKSIMGEGSAEGKPYKHIMANVIGSEADGNKCYNCHTAHSTFDTLARAKNTKYMDWDDVNKVMFNDQKLCQNCHNNTPPAGAAPVTTSYTSTGHSYDSQPVYHDYSDSDFKGNCSKCHNPHGTDNPYLLEMKSTVGNGKSGTSTYQPLDTYNTDANVMCVNCHSGAGSGNIATWPGINIYNKSPHKALANPGDGKHGTGSGLCVTCHDPHGKTDGSGLIPDLAKARGNTMCANCHAGSSGQWSGMTAYNASAHGAAQGGLCQNCHSAHGKDDGTGNPFPDLRNGALPQSCWNTAGCHGTGAAKDLQTPYSYTGATASNHTCGGCHNNHEAQPGTGFSGSLKGTTGANISSWPAAKTAEEGGGYASIPGSSWNTVTSGEMTAEWQLCFKCHSSNASSLGVSGAAEVSVYHNPNNMSTHGFEGPGADADSNGIPDNGMNAIIYKYRTNGPVLNGTYDANKAMLKEPWNTTLKTTCSDCHGNSSSTGVKGLHGSNYQYVLKWDFKSINACLQCHNANIYDFPTLGTTKLDPNKQSNGYVPHRRSFHFRGFTNTDFTNKYGNNYCMHCHYGRGNTYSSTAGASLHGANIKFSGIITGTGGLSDRGMNGFYMSDIRYNGGVFAKPELEGGLAATGSCNAGSCHGTKNY